jgi:hypothetical protein
MLCLQEAHEQVCTLELGGWVGLNGGIVVAPRNGSSGVIDVGMVVVPRNGLLGGVVVVVGVA